MIKIKELIVEPSKLYVNKMFKIKIKVQTDKLLIAENSKTIIAENDKKILLEWREQSGR